MLNIIALSISKESIGFFRSKTHSYCVNKNPQPLNLKCPSDNKQFYGSRKKTMMVELIDIESEDCSNINIYEQNHENLFFVESSGKDHLTARDACAIESAARNSGLAGQIIVAMTSPILDVMANNATCNIYKEYEGTHIFFRYVNIDTIFKGTPLYYYQLNGGLVNHMNQRTIVQYRYL